MINFRHWRIATVVAILSMRVGSPHRVTERPEKVRAAAIRRVTLAGLAVILVGAGPVAVAMAAPKSLEPGKDRQPSPTIVQVRGRQLPVDNQGRYWMSGNLIGRWTVLTAETLPGYAIPEAPWTLVQTGQERFDGCIDQNHSKHCDSDDPLGALSFHYVAWIHYEPNTGRLIEGNCVHPITSGSQDFAGARGVLTMHDIPVGRGEGVRTVYQGKIVLNAVPNEGAVQQSDDVSAVSGARAVGC
jgi:hypothetical protein